MAVLDPRRSFDPRALQAALDAQRRARGLTWAQLGRALHVSPSTISGMGRRAVIEGDGVLQMTWWLGRSVESFCAGCPPAPGPAPGDWQSTGRLLRFDPRALFAALNARRQARGLTWSQAAAEMPSGLTSAAAMTRLARGGRVDIYQTLAQVWWLGERIATFTCLATR